MSSTCTAHALANAIIDQLDVHGVDVNHSHVVQTLIKFSRHGNAAWPYEIRDRTGTIITMDEGNKQGLAITMEEVEKVDEFSPDHKHVLVYKRRDNSKHTVFVKRQKDGKYECLNSWGDYNPYPIIEKNKVGNILYRVVAKWKPATEG